MAVKANRLIYDIETTLLSFYAFAPGKQYLGHKQLVPGKSRFGIICIGYCWNKEPVQVLKWTADGGQERLIEELDTLIKKADHVIGKNSDRFDNKMINGIRALNGQPGMPEWTKYTDDLERQMRRYFRLPSQSLDYISSQFGLGGKVSMELSDWIVIDQLMSVELLRKDGMNDYSLNLYTQHMYKASLEVVIKGGIKAFNKMCFYCRKDVNDTRTLWNKLSQHFDPKFNAATFNEIKNACKHCASKDIVANGTRGVSGGVKYQQYLCNSCGRYAGRKSITQLNGRLL